MKQQEIRWHDLLIVCKTWGGPCESEAAIVKAEKTVRRKYHLHDSKIETSVELKKLYKTEIIFNKLSNPLSSLEYGVNKKSNSQLRTTLIAIVNHEESSSATIDAEEAVIQYLTKLSQE